MEAIRIGQPEVSLDKLVKDWLEEGPRFNDHYFVQHETITWRSPETSPLTALEIPTGDPNIRCRCCHGAIADIYTNRIQVLQLGEHPGETLMAGDPKLFEKLEKHLKGNHGCHCVDCLNRHD
jgi:hypothetical protein